MNHFFFLPLLFPLLFPLLSPIHAEFALDSRTREVAEPDGSTPLTVRLTVRRLGGTVGVIQVMWNVTSSDGMQLHHIIHMFIDILPTFMCDYFTGENSHPIKLFHARISHHTYIFVISGSSAMADILPVSSTLQFVTNVTQQDIVLSVLPDDIPEVAEVSQGTGIM